MRRTLKSSLANDQVKETAGLRLCVQGVWDGGQPSGETTGLRARGRAFRGCSAEPCGQAQCRHSRVCETASRACKESIQLDQNRTIPSATWVGALTLT